MDATTNYSSSVFCLLFPVFASRKHVSSFVRLGIGYRPGLGTGVGNQALGLNVSSHVRAKRSHVYLSVKTMKKTETVLDATLCLSTDAQVSQSLARP